MQIDEITRRILAAYSWPGNVRELENFMERLSILVDSDTVCMEDLPRKILDQVGDVSLLPPVEEDPPVCEVAAEPEVETPAAEAVNTSATLAQQPAAATPCAANGAFVWPNLGVLEAQGQNLKDFLDVVESRLIDEALAKADGVKNQAAELLGIKRTTLIEKLKKRSM